MSRKVTKHSHERCLERVLLALEREVLQASDEEVRHAALDLGIDPDTKGSIAWIGITFPAKMRVEEVFDIQALRERFRQRLKSAKKSD
jgi:hypothetical protein